MRDDLAAKLGLLEDVHRLHGQGPLEPEVPEKGLHFWRPREPAEDGVHVVQSVAHLVDRLVLGLTQVAGLVERILLEEEAHIVCGIEKVVVCQRLLHPAVLCHLTMHAWVQRVAEGAVWSWMPSMWDVD